MVMGVIKMFKKKSLKRDIIKLIFILFMFFILNIYFYKVYALNEWIDNYENENYIQYKEDIIRNSSLNCMELDYSDYQYLDGWDFRKNHTIKGASTNQTNYQVGIKVYYGSGTDGNESLWGITFGKIYTDSNCKTDFGDIRFTEENGITLLDYWLETKVDSNYGIFWVEISYLQESPNYELIYIYYGNPDASTTSNGDNTFIWFDDFEDEEINDEPDSSKWELIGVTGTAYILIKDNPDGLGQVIDVYDNDDGITTVALSRYVNYEELDYAIGYKSRIGNNGDNWQNWFYELQAVSNSSGTTISTSLNRLGNDRRYYNGASYVDYSPNCPYALNIWYRKEHRILQSGTNIYKLNMNGTEYTGSFWNPETSLSKYYIPYRARLEQAGHNYIDDTYIRKLCYTEPIHMSWGIEENLTGGYIQIGIFYTKDILNYVNGSSIVLLTNSTIPENDEIKIQFSPNNSSWYSHNEILLGYDNLVEGFESIDLRDLNYSSNLYMRFNFSDGGSDSTPRLYQLRLITSANETISENGEPDESYSALLIVGLVTGLVIGIGIYISKR